MTSALEIADLSVRFGGVAALQSVSLAVGAGELVGLIGPNGAGKTTLIDAVTGFTRYEGSVRLSDQALDGLRPDQRATRGLGRTFQSLELFEDLTVRENASVGARDSSAIASALATTRVEALADRLPMTLPPGTRRFVALARALAARPRMLLLDEVAAGLDGDERAALAEVIRQVVAGGSSVLLVDHDLGLVEGLSDRVVVLDGGRVIAEGPAAEVRNDDRVVAAYLGRP